MPPRICESGAPETRKTAGSSLIAKTGHADPAATMAEPNRSRARIPDQSAMTTPPLAEAAPPGNAAAPKPLPERPPPEQE